MHLKNYGIGHIILSIVSLVLNAILLCNLKKQKNKKPPQILLINLGIADSCIALASLGSAITQKASSIDSLGSGIRIVLMTIAMFFLVSLSTCWLITIDRLYAISKPLQHASYYDKKKLTMHIAASWIYPIIAMTSVAIADFSFDSVHTLARYILAPNLFVTLVLLAVAYTKIIKAILKSNSNLKRMSNSQPSQNSASDRRKTQIYIHSLFIILNFAICSSPYVCYSLFYSPKDHDKQAKFMAGATMALICITILDPMSYLFLNIVLSWRQKRLQGPEKSDPPAVTSTRPQELTPKERCNHREHDQQ